MSLWSWLADLIGHKPEFPSSKARSPVNVEVHALPRAVEALEFLRVEWEKALGAKLPAAKLPRVRWFKGDPLTYKGIALKVHSIFWGGGLNEIQVSISTAGANGKPSGTDLAHEILHWALLYLTGDGDAAHVGAEWKLHSAVHMKMIAAGF